MRLSFIGLVLGIMAFFGAQQNAIAQKDACGTSGLPISREVQAFGLQKMYERGEAPSYEVLDTAQILRIPVVFHVVHVGEAEGDSTNISDEQIFSAISALNDDFRKVPGTSGDGHGVDTKIEFCMASVDPDGNPTDGIVRHDASDLVYYGNGSINMPYVDYGVNAGNLNYYGIHDTWMKQTLGAWDTDLYLNVWTVNEIAGNNGGAGIQGYAYLGPISAQRDGIVILHNAVGTVGTLKSYTNMNKTLTHEVGHYLTLYHTFEYSSDCVEGNCNVEGDRVCDTPVTTGNTSCSSENCPGAIEENYMDYTPQTCRDMFTLGQAERMRECIYQLRPELLNSQAACDVDVDCPYDFDNDYATTLADVDILIYDLGCLDCNDTDLNADGIVTVEDLLILLTHFGEDCLSSNGTGGVPADLGASYMNIGDNAGSNLGTFSSRLVNNGELIFDMGGRIVNGTPETLSNGTYIIINMNEGKITTKKISIVK